MKKEEIDVEANGRGLFVNGSEDGARVLEDGGAGGQKKVLGMGEAGSREKGFRPETFAGCELDELGATEVEVLEWFIGEDVVKEEVWNDFAEGGGLEERGVTCKGEVMEDIVRVMLACAGEFGLSCKESLV